MNLYKTLCEEEGKEMSLESLAIKAKKINKTDAKIVAKCMIEVMAKLKYDNRIATKYKISGSGIKKIIYIKDGNN
ncbi:hypothetical protein [Enterococcus wangshanyuanii]|uniref:Uncharacterized protein n=1 Tax=Enterococcus wangshanyuanii TaxID=2005703 RepID=A0ABQ1PBV0_9ENTE|nr:hypothetical protein [Enterococcus wangshanyuanii]GGC94172.1 hypothetical protein GCM10011573_24760 [Enterococcus wangshanyuanii]